MRLQILHVADCPNTAVLVARLREVLAGRADVTVHDRVVDDADTATAVGMTGSPTLLVDGVDPFVQPGQPASLSCRLYRGDDGRVAGAPTVAALRAALSAGGDEDG